MMTSARVTTGKAGAGLRRVRDSGQLELLPLPVLPVRLVACDDCCFCVKAAKVPFRKSAAGCALKGDYISILKLRDCSQFVRMPT